MVDKMTCGDMSAPLPPSGPLGHLRNLHEEAMHMGTLETSAHLAAIPERTNIDQQPAIV